MTSSLRECFVIGPIGEKGSVTRRRADWMLRGVIKPVLECDELGYTVRRADETAAPGSITRNIISDVLNAELAIADLTGFNPNVFYEIGIRHAAGKPTIHVIAESVKLPFDNQDQRTIFVDFDDFDSVEDAKGKMLSAARAIQHAGYKVSNPVTDALGAIQLGASPDNRDRQILSLMNSIAEIDRNLKPSGPVSVDYAKRHNTAQILMHIAPDFDGLDWRELVGAMKMRAKEKGVDLNLPERWKDLGDDEA